MSEHRATLKLGTTTLESPTVQGITATVYTNAPNFNKIQVNWKSLYQPTHLSAPSSNSHPYIQRVNLGVVSASVTAVVNSE